MTPEQPTATPDECPWCDSPDPADRRIRADIGLPCANQWHTPATPDADVRDGYAAVLAEHSTWRRDIRWSADEGRWLHFWECVCEFEVRTIDASPTWHEDHVAAALVESPHHHGVLAERLANLRTAAQETGGQP